MPPEKRSYFIQENSIFTHGLISSSQNTVLSTSSTEERIENEEDLFGNEEKLRLSLLFDDEEESKVEKMEKEVPVDANNEEEMAIETKSFVLSPLLFDDKEKDEVKKTEEEVPITNNQEIKNEEKISEPSLSSSLQFDLFKTASPKPESPGSAPISPQAHLSPPLTSSIAENIVGDGRYPGEFSEGQGEHVSAYVLYRALALSILTSTNAHNAELTFKEKLACISYSLGQIKSHDIVNVYKKFQEKKKETMSLEDIANTRSALRMGIRIYPKTMSLSTEKKEELKRKKKMQ